jgi:coronin-1B/1C/6
VLDTDWSPHADNIVASGGEDGNVLIWQVDGSAFDGWNAEGWVPVDYSPVLRIDASPRKVGQVLWHPAAQHVLASAVGDHTVKLWDLGAPESPRAVLAGHADTIQSIAFNPTGQLLATTSRDRKIRLFDPRAGGEAVRVGEGHAGVKGARVVWMGEHDRIATTGFSRMSDRQVGVWEVGALKNLKTITLDQSAGVVMPFWSDNNILFLGEQRIAPSLSLSLSLSLLERLLTRHTRFMIIAGKGDGNIRYYEYESDNLYALDEHKSSDPQRGMCFVPRRAVNTSECEIARAYKVTTSQAIEPIAFIVPRKVSQVLIPSPPIIPHRTWTDAHTHARTQSDSFQSDIFPPASSIEPSLTAGDFFSGKPVSLKYVSLDTGAVSIVAPTSTPVPTPTRSATAPAPQPAPASAPSLSPVVAPSLTRVASEPPPPSPAPAPASVSAPASAYAPTPVSPADVHIPPSRSTSTYTPDVRFFFFFFNFPRGVWRVFFYTKSRSRTVLLFYFI